MRYRQKLMLSISLLLAITFGIGGTLLISTSFQSALSEEKTAAMESYETVRNTLYLLNSLSDNTDYDDISNALTQMEQQGVGHWQAISLDAENTNVYKSGDDSLLSANLPLPESGKCAYTILKDGNDSHRLQLTSTISTQDDELILEASFDLSSAYHARETQQRLFFVVYAVMVGLGCMLSYVMSLALTKHLKKLTDTVREISDGDLSKRSAIMTQDEFGQLSQDFDTMTDKLQENIQALEEDVQKKEAFMGAFAHELKTPMTSIIGYADLLRQDMLERPDRIDAANYIFSEGQRLHKLSFQLMDLLMLEKDDINVRQVELSSLIDDIEKALKPVLEKKNVKLMCRCESGTVLLEPDLVKSLLYNLVDNGSKAIDKNGIIAIKGEINDDGCHIQVIDNGRGMYSDELPRITEPFYRVDKSRSRKQGGAGLGLALCSKIVELHGGSIGFSSKVNSGTCVTVALKNVRRDADEET